MDVAHGSLEWALGHSAANTELNYSEELSLVCQSVTMNLIVGQDGILQLVGNENGSPQVPRRDDESEHQEGRKELQGRFSRNRFEVCEEKIVARCDIDQSRILSLREAVSLGGGWGFIKCNCSGNKKKGGANRCKCFKNHLKCNSRCHNSLSCTNK